MGISKVEINNADGTKNVLVDLTGDTVTADMLAEGIMAHSANGELVTGIIKEGNPNHKTGTPSYSSNIVKLISIKSTANEDAIIRSGSKFSATASASDFGDATVDDVAKGKTFTSVNGLKITGTHECSGGLDTSDATAVSSDLKDGKTAYVNGKKITGTLLKANQVLSPNLADDNGVSVGRTRGTDGISRLSLSYYTKSERYFETGTYVSTEADFENFGDATAEDVAKGKTFTSAAGFKVTGTHECSSGGDSTLNCEMQTISNVTSPKVTFNGTGGTYKVYGYGKGTSSGYTTPKYAFAGNKYYTISSWGNDTTNTLNITVDSSGNISGLPSLTSGELVIVRVPS